MTATTTGTSLVPVADRFVFTDGEQLALVGFLAGYRGATRDAYRMDLRLFGVWCAQHDLALFEVQRVDIECYARQLEERGRARATVARRLCTVSGFYRYAEQEGLIPRSPAVHVRRPRLDYEPHAIGLDRNELGALLVAAGLAGAREHALISLLALNGLRISEALGVDIDDLSVERGHRTITVVRKGAKIVTMPLAPRVARAMDLAIGDRAGGPVFLAVSGRRMDRHAASRIVRRVARAARLDKHISPPRHIHRRHLRRRRQPLTLDYRPRPIRQVRRALDHRSSDGRRDLRDATAAGTERALDVPIPGRP